MRTTSLIIGILLICLSVACTGHIRKNSQTAIPEKDPSFYKWTSMDVINAFKKQGLEVDDIRSGFIVGVHKTSENKIFMMNSYGKDLGAVVSSLDSKEALEEYEAHYTDMNRGKRLPVWWIFSKDNIVLLISGKVPEKTARQYEKVLNSMKTKSGRQPAISLQIKSAE